MIATLGQVLLALTNISDFVDSASLNISVFIAFNHVTNQCINF